jgi:methylphosphotriester-DNA--protein-cysteine methyltransferase
MAALALTGALLAGGTAAAIAAVTKDSGKQREQAVLDDAAKRLNVSPQQLRDALSAAQDAQIDQAVKDGKLTQKQADAIKAARKQSGRVLGGGPERGFGHHGFGPGHGAAGAIFPDLAKALGVTKSELRTQLQAGKSIADIAKAQGKTLDEVRASLKAGAKTAADKAVKDSDITQAQADELLAHLDDALTHLGEAGPRLHFRGHRGEGPVPDLRPGGFKPGSSAGAPDLNPAGAVFS